MRETTILDVLQRRAERDPESGWTDLGVPGSALTFAQLQREGRALAAWLIELGVKPGDPVVLVYPQEIEFIRALFACMFARAIAVPVPAPHVSRLKRVLPRLEAIMRTSGASLVLTSQKLVAAFDDAMPGHGLRIHATSDVTGNGVGELPTVRADDIAFIQYSSGSTGEPRGVAVRQSSLLANLDHVRAAGWSHAETVIVSWLPFFHDMGLLTNVFVAVHVAKASHFMSPLSFLKQPRDWLMAITKHADAREVLGGGPNFAFDLCLRRISSEQLAGLELSHWKAYCGAEPIRAETVERFLETFGSVGMRRTAFHPCYGLAEVTVFASGQKDPDEVYRSLTVDTDALGEGTVVEATSGRTSTLVGCGRPATPSRLVIVDGDRRVVPDNVVGEIWVAGAHVAAGYWNDAPETARYFGVTLAGGSDDERFLRTGDLGFMRDGILFVTGRLKDLIIVAGKNHYPQDLERTVELAHPSVRPGCVAAFSIPGATGEEVALVVEVERRVSLRPDDPQPHHTPDAPPPFEADAVLYAIVGAVAQEHEVAIGRLVLVKGGSVPKTSSGKIQRAACRAALLADQLSILGEFGKH